MSVHNGDLDQRVLVVKVSEKFEIQSGFKQILCLLDANIQQNCHYVYRMLKLAFMIERCERKN